MSFKTLRFCVKIKKREEKSSRFALLSFLAFKGFKILNKNEAFADCGVQK